MANPITAALDKLYKRKITDVTLGLAKRSRFFVVQNSAPTQCPNCRWDPAGGASSGQYNGTGPTPFTSQVCPVCKNIGRIFTVRNIKVEANVNWVKSDKDGVQPRPAGDIDRDMASVKILYRDKPIVETADHFLIDGMRFVLVGGMHDHGLRTYVTVEFMVKKED